MTGKEESEELRRRLLEAEETLRAIGEGEVDAFVVSGPQGEIVYTLKGSEHPYRVFYEAMTEGAVTLSKDGTVLACNGCFLEMVRSAEGEILGRPLSDFVADEERSRLSAFMRRSLRKQSRTETVIVRSDGALLSAQLSATRIDLDEAPSICLVITDISDRKAAEEEVKRLNRDLEQKVRERTAELESANEQLRKTISEHEEAKAALEAAFKKIGRLNEDLSLRNEELETANRELETFAYSVSHDLRAPMRSVSGFSRILLDDYSESLDDQGRNYLIRIYDATLKLEKLIEDLLSLSRLMKRDMDIMTVDLSTIVRDIFLQLKEKDPDRKVDFIIEEGIRVRGDYSLLRIAMQNLIENAWKFSAGNPSARIEFGVSGDAERICFVKDNGAGFDMKYSDKMFQPFQRLHSEQEFPGTGIGLATVYRILKRLGGRIWAEGTPGKGATFYFNIGQRPADQAGR